ncbi:MAG TPA: BREX-1 system phosphatase PglZ type A, partial [Anaerolineales bacterium]|nr:BREX-1 system phosphatase PglZ type A [Anaerolineales bacterium]
MAKIAQALDRLFEKYRIVFWYDEKKELRGAFESLLIPGVETIELKNNEYGVKYHILREKPAQKFLLYHEGPQPDDLDNWLLDVQLASGLFNANQEALWANEIGLQPQLFDLVTSHIEFFKDEKRRAALKARYKQEDSRSMVQVRMLTVCAKAEVEDRVESVVESLLDELAEEEHEKIQLIQRCQLDDFLWSRLKIHFDYESSKPGVKDFAITLFKTCYQLSVEENNSTHQDVLVFLKRWRDNVHYQEAFEKLAGEYQEILAIERDLEKRDFRKLAEIDFFEIIDKKILRDLAQHIFNRTISAGDCANFIWRRRTTHWYGQFSNIYQSLYFASQFMHELDQAELKMESLPDGIRKYQATWYRLDQYYRKFIYHARASRQPLLDKLTERIESLYANNYLLTVNDNWQHLIDSAEVWSAAPIRFQAEFFESQVREVLGSKNKLAVIISDALRYEIGEELVRVIQEEDRYTAELEPMLASLPSYTQLGMATLLPHTHKTIVKDGNVQLDGQSATGTENRAKILSAATANEATAIKASEFLALNRDESRELTKTNRVLYIYHNQIDAVGDDTKSEERVFDAAQDSLREIMDIIKKLAGANFSNFIVTADHGFIYQNQALEDSDFAVEEPKAQEILFRSRRFVIGKGFKVSKSLKEFSAHALGLDGDFSVMIPKSINRLRLQGSGSRYVHGGASRQRLQSQQEPERILRPCP